MVPYPAYAVSIIIVNKANPISRKDYFVSPWFLNSYP